MERERAQGRARAERGRARQTRAPEPGDFWSEAGGALALVGLFVAVGLGAATLARGYPPAVVNDGPREEAPLAGDRASGAEGHLWLVDGFNVLHAAVLKGRDRREWWRGPARARVLALAGGLPDADAEIVVVFDGEDPDEAPELPPRVRQVFAPSADDWLVRRVKQTPLGAAVTVVTADRQLADRVRHHGAEIVSPRAFAARCREG
jgi:predicted RNA-binding protein with PIN domain